METNAGLLERFLIEAANVNEQKNLIGRIAAA
jgi:hypothetical protein